MRTNLPDITFLILVRIDSVQRLENLSLVTTQLVESFNTNIYVKECARYNNHLLESILHHTIKYEYVEDKDPVFYRTMHLNKMISKISTPFFAIWDADVIVNKHSVIDCMEKLREGEICMALPYGGICYDISEIIKTLFLKKKDIRVLSRHKGKMETLYPPPLVGGAVLFDKKRYLEIGMENEKYYGWGNEDYDRHQRVLKKGFQVYHANSDLFHLTHPRDENGIYSNKLKKDIGTATFMKTLSM